MEAPNGNLLAATGLLYLFCTNLPKLATQPPRLLPPLQRINDVQTRSVFDISLPPPSPPPPPPVRTWPPAATLQPVETL